MLACRLILECSSYIKESETELQEDKGIRAIMQTPDNPQHVAQQKQPEAPIPFKFPLGRHQPRRNYRDYHCRPLNYVDPTHLKFPNALALTGYSTVSARFDLYFVLVRRSVSSI